MNALWNASAVAAHPSVTTILSPTALLTTFGQVGTQVFKGIRTKQVWQLRPTEPGRKRASANKHSHGNDDGAGPANSSQMHFFAPTVWVKDFSSVGVQWPTGNRTGSIATGDYSNRQQCPDLQHRTFVIESSFYLFWWLPGCLLTATSGWKPSRPSTIGFS